MTKAELTNNHQAMCESFPKLHQEFKRLNKQAFNASRYRELTRQLRRTEEGRNICKSGLSGLITFTRKTWASYSNYCRRKLREQTNPLLRWHLLEEFLVLNCIYFEIHEHKWKKTMSMKQMEHHNKELLRILACLAENLQLYSQLIANWSTQTRDV